MRTLFDNAAFFQHDDAICLADRRDTVRDQDYRAAAHDAAQSFENTLFGKRIDARKRIVQD